MDVDELADSLAGTASMHNPGIFAATAPHPRFFQYKTGSWTKNFQENRRKELLEKQKISRNAKFDDLRRIYIDGIQDVVDDDQRDEMHLNKTTTYKLNLEEQLNSHGNGNFKEKSCCQTDYKFNHRHFYADKLMLSEWLVDVPDDLTTGWYMVPVPVGRRRLLVKERRRTRLMTKTGYCVEEFSSKIADDNRDSSTTGCTWLDCIFGDDNVIYILDCIWSKNHSICDGERDFRYFWLQTLFSDCIDLEAKSKSNKYKIVLLPQFHCDLPSIEKAIDQKFDYKLDGFLFYCNAAHYVPGLTPLVGWLKPFMLREILGVVNFPKDPVSASQFDPPEKIDGHVVDTKEFIEEFDEAERMRKNAKSKKT